MRTARRTRDRAPAYQDGGDGTSVARRWRRGMLRLVPARFYRHTLVGRVPTGIKLKVARAWPADPKRGGAIAAGDLELARKLVRSAAPLCFASPNPQEAGAAWHSFDWIADLFAAGPSARATARQLVDGWLAEKLDFASVAWRSDVLATRLFAWITHFDDIVADKDPALKRAVLASLAKQHRHLARVAAWEVEGAARLRAVKGLLAGTLALGGSAAKQARVLGALGRQLPTQFFADGGHRSRSPSVQLQVLQDLIDIRSWLRAAHIDPPAALQDAIERAAPILRLFRHGDRRLALFNGALEEDGVLIDLVLTQSETRGRTLSRAPQTGFERLQAGKTVVLVETGTRPPAGFDAHAHAGALSFEMSDGRERIIVNCGAYRGAKANWWLLPRASAAHSVLVVADTNSAVIGEDGGHYRRPISVTCERAEHEGQQWVSASHDGYRERFGLTYTRELFLAADGDDLRGEERLTGRPGANFAVRFHLHPAVGASQREGENTALLQLPSGSSWRLRAVGAEMSLGESVYLGSGEARKTQQVILSGTAAPGGTTVRWALRREPGRAGLD
jgi:uncharacterized heparinase superfamily protein